MIHIFRVFNTNHSDYLEFLDKPQVVENYKMNQNPQRFNWQVVAIDQALKQETRRAQRESLQVIKQRGEARVIKVISKAEVHWYSPSNSHGIPSEYQVAIQHFTDQCQYYKVTSRHQEIFKVIRDPRFQNLHRSIVDSILSKVEATRCAQRLDRYLDLNLNKLYLYGVEIEQLHGTYSQIRNTITQKRLNCPLFSDFLLRLLDICIAKEKELLGKNQTYQKQLRTG